MKFAALAFTVLLSSLAPAQQPDQACFTFYQKNADSLSKAYLPSTNLTKKQRDARTRLDSLMHARCIKAVPPDTTTPVPPDTIVPVPPDTTTPPPSAGPAILPLTYLNFSYPAKTGQTITVSAGGNLQGALNTAQPGDEVVLAAGATFTGNFILPTRCGTGWIVIRSSALNQLPPQGTRVTPNHAALMPKIVSPNYDPALKTSGALCKWWIAGVEITISPSVTVQNYGLLWLGLGGSPQTSLASVPYDLVVDRSYIHGQSTTQLSRCVALNSASTQITDSWLDDCHGKGFDSQAIWGSNGPGPYKIVNNTLRGAGENIMFGGGDPAIAGLVPSDIEIRRNHIETPLSWKGVWTKKNIFELKNARRVLVEGNVLEGSWYDGQGGEAIVIKSTNQNGGCRWCRTTDVTFRWNLIQNAGGGVNAAWADAHAPVDTGLTRVYFIENVFNGLNGPTTPGIARGLAIYGVKNITFERTVLTGTLASLTFFETVSTNCKFLDSYMVPGMYGLSGTNTGGVGTLQTYCPTYTWQSMTILGTASGTGWPPGTLFSVAEPAGAAAIRQRVAQATIGVVVTP